MEKFSIVRGTPPEDGGFGVVVVVVVVLVVVVVVLVAFACVEADAALDGAGGPLDMADGRSEQAAPMSATKVSTRRDRPALQGPLARQAPLLFTTSA